MTYLFFYWFYTIQKPILKFISINGNLFCRTHTFQTVLFHSACGNFDWLHKISLHFDLIFSFQEMLDFLFFILPFLLDLLHNFFKLHLTRNKFSYFNFKLFVLLFYSLKLLLILFKLSFECIDLHIFLFHDAIKLNNFLFLFLDILMQGNNLIIHCKLLILHLDFILHLLQFSFQLK